jgi:hypothetical protein
VADRLPLFRASERSIHNSRQSSSAFCLLSNADLPAIGPFDSSLQASRYHPDGTSFLTFLLNGNALDFGAEANLRS